MAEKEENKESSCEGKGSCGCGGCCITGKILAVALLLFIGGILGYLLAGNCRSKKMCGAMEQPCPMMGGMPADHMAKK
jgi:hypothetical protein